MGQKGEMWTEGRGIGQKAGVWILDDMFLGGYVWVMS